MQFTPVFSQQQPETPYAFVKGMACLFVLMNLVGWGRAYAQDGWLLLDLSREHTYRAISCADSDDCMMVGVTYGRGFVRWTDGGTLWRTLYTWSGQQVGGEGFLCYDIAHPNVARALVACDSGQVLGTTDYGLTWSRTGVGANERLLKITMYDTGNGLVASRKHLWRTDDGGRSWQGVTLPASTYEILDIEMPDTNHFILLMSGWPRHYVQRTSDGGATWQRSDTLMYLYDIDFIDGNTGWACGATPFGDHTSHAWDLIYKTTDGGVTWTEQLNDSIERPFGLYAIAFADSLNGIACGREAKILRTANGGRTWRSETSGLYADNFQVFNGVEFPTTRRAYIISGNGHFFRKGDGTENGWAGVPVSAAAADWDCSLTSNVIMPGQPIDLQLCSEREQQMTVQLIDPLGVERAALHAVVMGCEEQRVPIDGLHSGLYFVVVHGTAGRTVVPVRVL